MPWPAAQSRSDRPHLRRLPWYHELPSQQTRLLVRTRANYSPSGIRLLSLPLGLFDATYGVVMLRAIARRAEGAKAAGT
jgi:hypothetical protein